MKQTHQMEVGGALWGMCAPPKYACTVRKNFRAAFAFAHNVRNVLKCACVHIK